MNNWSGGPIDTAVTVVAHNMEFVTIGLLLMGLLERCCIMLVWNQ